MCNLTDYCFSTRFAYDDILAFRERIGWAIIVLIALLISINIMISIWEAIDPLL